MSDSLLGTFFPMFPRNILLEKQLKSRLEGRTINEVAWTKYYEGQYSWHGDEIPGLDQMKGQKIMFADASNILTENGTLAFFAYEEGGIYFFEKGEEVSIPKIKKSVSHAYYATFKLDDGSCLGINQYGWGTFFKILNVDINKIDTEYESKSKRYPFIAKNPIDVTDEEDFTLEKFKEWLSNNPNANLIENCVTAKGVFRIDNPVMSYILLISKVHPKIKTKALTDHEIETIYNNTKELIAQYKSEFRRCKQIDIYGKGIEASNDIVWMNAATLNTPCPICGKPIEATPIAGTKMYYCPKCQSIKKK